MKRTIAAVMALGLLAACAEAPPEPEAAMDTTAAPPAGEMAPTPPTDPIENALTAAPPEIAEGATIMAWPATDGGDFVTLRPGSNAWTCLPDFPGTEGNDPMCLDEEWMRFTQAYSAQQEPDVQRVGFGYMIAPGGAHGSNTDPYATGETADNEWGYDPPHLMILVPDASALEGLPVTRDAGGPFVMWRGTSYAHIMAPLESTQQ